MPLLPRVGREMVALPQLVYESAMSRKFQGSDVEHIRLGNQPKFLRDEARTLQKANTKFLSETLHK